MHDLMTHPMRCPVRVLKEHGARAARAADGRRRGQDRAEEGGYDQAERRGPHAYDRNFGIISDRFHAVLALNHPTCAVGRTLFGGHACMRIGCL